jgi:hypothetical protein
MSERPVSTPERSCPLILHADEALARPWRDPGMLDGMRHPDSRAALERHRPYGLAPWPKAQGARASATAPTWSTRQRLGRAVVKADADAFAANALPVIRPIEAQGATTLRAIAAALNERAIRTARGGEWYGTTVRNLLVRLP